MADANDPILQVAKVLVKDILSKQLPSKENQDLLIHWAFQLVQLVELVGTHLKGPQKLRAVQCALLELVDQKSELFLNTLPQDFIHDMVPVIVGGAIGLAKQWAPAKNILQLCCSM